MRCGDTIDCEKWDFHTKLSQCSKKLSKSGDVLIVVSSKNVRGGVAKVFGGRCAIVEAIDDEVFYRTARKIDAVQAGNALSLLNEVAQVLFTKTGVGEWLTEKGVKKKRKESDRLVSVRLSEAVEIYEKTPTPIAFFQCLKELEGLPNVSLLWHDQFHSLKSAIEIAKAKEMSVCDAMAEVRNRIRAMGRHLRPFSVGTTLVTKGLEFDHVVVVDMNPPFAKIPSDWRKHFYVAISRARKSLTIVREKAG